MVKRSHYLKGITIMANLETKLKALLAAGLIGTAGLGMQSCSNPSDPVYYPYTVEAPSTDNPGSGGEENGNGGGIVEETEEQKWAKTPFGQLNVKKEAAARIANVDTVTLPGEIQSIVNIYMDLNPNPNVYVYTGSEFKDMTPSPEADKASMYQTISERFANSSAIAYVYVDKDGDINKLPVYMYFIPEDLGDSFDDAITAYRASQSNQ